MMIGIFIISSIPSTSFPKIDFEWSDKLIHLVIYFFLYLTFYYSLKNQNKLVILNDKVLLFSVIFTSVYGASDEFHQYFVPNRSCDIYDWLADVSGGLIALCVILIYNKSKQKEKIKLKYSIYDSTK